MLIVECVLEVGGDGGGAAAGDGDLPGSMQPRRCLCWPVTLAAQEQQVWALSPHHIRLIPQLRHNDAVEGPAQGSGVLDQASAQLVGGLRLLGRAWRP